MNTEREKDLPIIYRWKKEDLVVIMFGFVSFFILRRVLQKFVFVPFANYLQISKEKKKGKLSSKYQKFLENMWYSTFYPVLTVNITFNNLRFLKFSYFIIEIGFGNQQKYISDIHIPTK
jgi:UV DNA damage repair endonuclease